MSDSRTSHVLAGVVGGALVMVMGMGVVLLGAFVWLTPAGTLTLDQATPQSVVASEPEPELEVEVAPEPEPEPEPEPPALADAELEDATTAPVEEAEIEADEPKTASRTGCVPSARGIDQIAPKKWRVKRSLIEKYTSNSTAASSLARVKWAKTKSGKTRGLRLTRVPCKSPMRAAGFQSKDLILEVDGKSVTSYAQGLRIWAAIRRKSSFTVKIRRGKTVRIHRYILS